SSAFQRVGPKRKSANWPSTTTILPKRNRPQRSTRRSRTKTRPSSPCPRSWFPRSSNLSIRNGPHETPRRRHACSLLPTPPHRSRPIAIPQPALPIRLPDPAGVGFERGQPAAAGAIRVDADEEAEIEDVAGQLPRVADHGDLAGAVGDGRARVGDAPAQGEGRLPFHRQ